jgi:hypothetical protein
MKRRKFIASTLAASVLPVTQVKARPIRSMEGEKEIYELRTYDVKFRGNQKVLKDYLQEVLKPALERFGANHFLVLSEMGLSEPPRWYVLISYPDANIYFKSLSIMSDKDYLTTGKSYHDLPPEEALYTRYGSSLFLAFDGMPQMDGAVAESSLFELRTYEGYSEDAVRRKINMFNKEEIAVFHKTNLKPVFFGEMITGPYRPCLTYMLHFKDMEQRNAHWRDFGSHPDWRAMRVKPEYAHTVSNIRKIFLEPLK